MTAPSLEHALRTAEGLEVAPGYRPCQVELIRELAALIVTTREATLTARHYTERAAHIGAVAEVDR